MKVAFDATVTQLCMGGVAVYVNELLPELCSLLDPDGCLPFHYRLRFDRSNRALAKVETAFRDMVWNNVFIPTKIRGLGADLFHSPQIRTTFLSPVPTVITVYDCWALHNPQGFSRWTAFYRRVVPAMLRHARAIVVISEFTRRELLRFFPLLDPAKIVVTPLGVSSDYRQAPHAACVEVRQRHRLPDRYLLAVNTLEPRKNLLPFIRAFEQAQDDLEEDLVLIGSHGWIPGHLREILDAIAKNPRIHYLGYVPREDIASLYTSATAYVFPSLYEGFGLPAIEAMACGCPVVASRGSGLDEAIGDAGLLFDPRDVADMAQHLIRICIDATLRDELRKKGTARSETFSWARTARLTVEAYRLALRSRELI